MSEFQPAVDALLINEGGVFVEDDNGRGPCKWGISLATAKGFGLNWDRESIWNLDRSGAEDFYRTRYWQGAHVELLSDQDVANKVLDLLVNVGPVAIKWLQSAADVCEDMVLGPQTAAAVNAMDPTAVLAGMRARGEHYYRSIVAQKPEEFAQYLDGWLARLAK